MPSDAAPSKPLEVEVLDGDVRKKKLLRDGALTFALSALITLGIKFAVLRELGALEVGGALAAGVVMTRLLVWLLKRRRAAWRPAAIGVAPGRLDVRAQDQSLVVRSGSILSASTAVRDDGTFEWALHLPGRSRPLLIRTRSRDDLEALQANVAFGQRDVSPLTWDVGTSTWSVLLASTLFLVGLFLGTPLGGAAAVAALLLFGRSKQSIALSGGGIHVRGAYLRGAAINKAGLFLPYNQIVRVERIGSRLYVDVAEGFYAPATQRALLLELQNASILGEAELDHIVAQIKTAVRRAKGERAPAGTRDETLAVLERRGNTADWVAQLSSLDALQSQGYRGTPLDRDALVRVATDPDASHPARFAAARLLRHDMDARPRIDVALDAARSEPERKMLRIALEDEMDPARVLHALADVDRFEERRRERS